MNSDLHAISLVTQRLLRLADQAAQSPERWDYLIAAHIAGQTVMRLHLQTHVAMLQQAWHDRDALEMAGQLFRLALVPLGHALSRLPLGNTGRARVSAFAPMPIEPKYRLLIERAFHPAS